MTLDQIKQFHEQLVRLMGELPYPVSSFWTTSLDRACTAFAQEWLKPGPVIEGLESVAKQPPSPSSAQVLDEQALRDLCRESADRYFDSPAWLEGCPIFRDVYRAAWLDGWMQRADIAIADIRALSASIDEASERLS